MTRVEFAPEPTRLEVVAWLVLWLCRCKVVFQKGLDVLECRSLVRFLLPALPHHLVKRLGAALGAGHPVTSIHLLEYLAVHHTWRKTNQEITRQKLN